MNKKRFVYGIIKGSRQAHIKDCHTCKSATIDVYDDNFKYFVDKLNEQQATIDKLDQENADLLGARIKAQEEWEKCTDKLKEKIVEQQALIEEQNKLIEKLRWDLDKTRKDLDFFATLKVTAMKGCEPMDETTNLEHQTWTGGKR